MKNKFVFSLLIFLTVFSISKTVFAATAQEDVIIKNGNSIIYNGPVDLPASGTVQIPDKSGTTHSVDAQSVLSVIYSIENQANSSFSFSDLEYNTTYSSFYLKCLTPNGESELCNNWQYNVNDSYPLVGMGQKILSGGEKIYLYFGPQNKVILDKTTMDTSETLNVTALKYDYKNNTWLKRPGVTVGVTKPDPKNLWSPDDSIRLLVDKTTAIASFSNIPEGIYNVGIKEDYYWPTVKLTVNKKVAVISSGGGGGTSTATLVVPDTFFISKALNFIYLNQKANGSFSSPLYTDWVAVAVAKAGNEADSIKTKIRNYLINENFNSSVVTDNEREAMALMALNINPYSGTKTNYIKKITDSFDGQQIGDSSLSNDDIFGLIVLAKAGYTINDNIISKTIDFVISKQQPDGLWGSVDMTAAAIQALSNFKKFNNVSGSILKGLDYLSGVQDSGGSFSNNSFSTSWASQAFSTDSSFKTQATKTLGYLATKQQSDGGLENIASLTASRIWATAYAIPAALSLSWNKILNNFPKPASTASNSISSTTINKKENITSTTKNSLKLNQHKKEARPIIPVLLIKANKKNTPKLNVKITKIKPLVKKVTSAVKIINKISKIKKIEINKKTLLANAASASKENPISGSKIVLFISGILLIVVWGFVLNFKV